MSLYEKICRDSPRGKGLISDLYSSFIGILFSDSFPYMSRWETDGDTHFTPVDWVNMLGSLRRCTKSLTILKTALKLPTRWYYTPRPLVDFMPSTLACPICVLEVASPGAQWYIDFGFATRSNHSGAKSHILPLLSLGTLWSWPSLCVFSLSLFWGLHTLKRSLSKLYAMLPFGPQLCIGNPKLSSFLQLLIELIPSGSWGEFFTLYKTKLPFVFCPMVGDSKRHTFLIWCITINP